MSAKVFRNIPLEQHPQNVLLEIPAVHATAKIVGDVPYHTMERCPSCSFLLSVIVALSYRKLRDISKGQTGKGIYGGGLQSPERMLIKKVPGECANTPPAGTTL